MKRQVPEGVKVFVEHFRVATDDPAWRALVQGRLARNTDPRDAANLVRAGEFKAAKQAPHPNGGLTRVTLYTGNSRDEDVDTVAVGEASCSLQDGFNARLGRTIALGRALAELDGTLSYRAARRDPA